ncbi:MAG: DNA alkylation repair protein [Carnobacterium maltaromaticum]
MMPLVLPENKDNRQAMEAYMKNRFIFKGIKAPERRLLEKELLKESQKWPMERVLKEIESYYQEEAREYQYIAADLLLKNYKRMSYPELKSLFPLINQKAWWDTVDVLRSSFSKWCLLNPAYFHEIFTYFTRSESFWDRRVALNLQLGFKEQTDQAYLKQSILQDLATDEFFIQKAIGWALRDYSKTNPEWVTKFITENSGLSTLAVREGSKYI